jgi:hypothetical protein
LGALDKGVLVEQPAVAAPKLTGFRFHPAPNGAGTLRDGGQQ